MRALVLWISLAGTTAVALLVGGCENNQTTSFQGGSSTASKDVLAQCDSCHTKDASKRLAGGISIPGQRNPAFDPPELWSPNLTPDVETGLGGLTDDQLRVAIRDGVDRNGVALCPPMKHYTSMSEAEMSAVIKGLRALPPVKNQVKPSSCPPLKFRQP